MKTIVLIIAFLVLLPTTSEAGHKRGNDTCRDDIKHYQFFKMGYGSSIYEEQTSHKREIKITVRFLSNEIRADGLKVIIYKKICNKNDQNNCKTIQDNTTLGQEIKLAILKKAATIKDSEISEGQKNYSSTGAGRQQQSKY